MKKAYFFKLEDLEIPEKFNWALKSLYNFPLFYELDNKGNSIRCGFIRDDDEKRNYDYWIDVANELVKYESWKKFTEEQACCFYEEFLPAFEDACVKILQKNQ